MDDGPTTGDPATEGTVGTVVSPGAVATAGTVAPAGTVDAASDALATQADGAAPAPPHAVGLLVAGRYRIEDVVGAGGMATVYRARDAVLGRVVALKVITPDADDPAAVGRERTEIELLASLNHHSLVTLYDAGVTEIDGRARTYLVMELVRGSTLADRIAGGPLAAAEVARMAADLAEALHVVHEHGVVHRDIKPGNVLVSPSPVPGRELTVKLADFGIAHLIDSTRLTVAGSLVGTAAYLSPEQAQGHPPAPSSDLYSLGLVLLEALTGTRAFPGSLVESVSARLVADPPVPTHVGEPWRSVLTSMTHRAPEKRPTALDVALAARAIERGDAPPAPDATAVLPALAPVPAPAAPVPPVPVAEQLPGAPRAASARRAPRRRSLVALLAAVLVLGGAGAAVRSASADAEQPPTLPAVEEPLGTHLDELLQSVTP